MVQRIGIGEFCQFSAILGDTLPLFASRHCHAQLTPRDRL